MSDAKLPAEGVVVLAWWGDEVTPGAFDFARYHDERWECKDSIDDWDRVNPPRGWVSLAHAKAAGRLAEALRAVASGDVPGVSIGPRQREWANEVLREIGT